MSTTANSKIGLKNSFRLRPFAKKVFPACRKLETICKKKVFRLPSQFFSPAEKNGARPKSRVALGATSILATVTQNVFFYPDVALALRRDSKLKPGYT